jgi:hypothetical protein
MMHLHLMRLIPDFGQTKFDDQILILGPSNNSSTRIGLLQKEPTYLTKEIYCIPDELRRPINRAQKTKTKPS